MDFSINFLGILVRFYFDFADFWFDFVLIFLGVFGLILVGFSWILPSITVMDSVSWLIKAEVVFDFVPFWMLIVPFLLPIFFGGVS